MFRKFALAVTCSPSRSRGEPGLRRTRRWHEGCLSSKEARSAVQNGHAVSLSKMVKRIQKATGGEILPTPQLCKMAEHLVYLVKVLRPDGQVETLTVDAASGNISGY